jgi:AcrR family transcriptional regulator
MSRWGSVKKRTPRPREETKQETRDALIGAAARLFHERGLDAPSLDDICAAAGYTRGAFYVHFKDREELVTAVATQMNERRIERLIAESGEALGLEQTVKMFAEAVATGAYPGVGAVKLHQFFAAIDRSEKVRENHVRIVRKASERLADAAREGQRAGRIRDDIPAEVIGELLSVLVAGVEVRLEIGAPVDVARGARALLKMLRVPADR